MQSFTAGAEFRPSTDRLIHDIEVLPQQPRSVAVALDRGGLGIFDNGVERQGTRPDAALDKIAFGADGNTIYGCSSTSPEVFSRLRVGVNGASLIDSKRLDSSSMCGRDFEISNQIMYSLNGAISDPEKVAVIGRQALPDLGTITNVRPDPSTGRIFYLSYNGTRRFATILTFDMATSTFVGSFDIQNVNGNPSGFVRWGTDGLAFRTPENEVHFAHIPPWLMAPVRTSYLSQFVTGGSYIATITLTNPSSGETARGSINLMDSNGMPIFVNDDIERDMANFPFTLPPLGSATFSMISRESSGLMGISKIMIGSARVSSTIDVGAVIRFGDTNVGLAGVGASVPTGRCWCFGPDKNNRVAHYPRILTRVAHRYRY
jgi:hypothetical protein